MHYAGFWVRFFAGMLDVAFLIPPFLILAFLFGGSEFYWSSFGESFQIGAASSANKSFLDIIGYGLSITYLGYFLASKQQATIGKRILGIYVGNPDGSRITPARSLARAIASLLTSATLGLGFLLVIFTKEKTALHDLICNTRVFHGKKNV